MPSTGFISDFSVCVLLACLPAVCVCVDINPIVSLKKSRRLKFSTLADFIFEHTVENLVKRFFNLRPWIVDISLILYSTVGGEVYVNSDVFQ